MTETNTSTDVNASADDFGRSTSISRLDDNLADIALRKRLLYRSTHRGTQEADLLLGRYVAAHIWHLSSQELAELEEVLILPDDVIVKFLILQEPLPSGHASRSLEKARAFALADDRNGGIGASMRQDREG